MATSKKIWVKVSESSTTELWKRCDPNKIPKSLLHLERSKINPNSKRYRKSKEVEQPINNKIVNGIFFRKCEDNIIFNKRKFGHPKAVLVSDDQLSEYGWGNSGYSVNLAKSIFNLRYPINLKRSDMQLKEFRNAVSYCERSVVYFKDNTNDVFIECEFIDGKKSMLLLVY